MAVRLELKANRYIGKSFDVKPIVGQQVDATGTVTVLSQQMPEGSTFFEEDTGDIYRWNGTAWMLPRRDDRLLDAVINGLADLQREVTALRQGMTLAGYCEEVSPEEV